MPEPMTQATWTYPTTVLFGAGSVAKVARAAQGAGMARPLLVTDAALAALPIPGRVMALLEEGGHKPALFAEAAANPGEGDVLAGLERLRSGGHDGVVALGGGSALDTGKAIAFMAGQEQSIFAFEDRGSNWKAARSEGILPVIAVPTTAGTGSEVGRAAVITDHATHTKKIVFHPLMLPRTAILDPELTVGLPPALTAGTGMDALAHCLEAYCAPTFHPMGEGIAVEGMRLVKEALPRAYKDGADLEARGWMLAASAMGAVAFQKGLGAIHALSHPLGAVYGTHHGTTNAVVMPYVLAANHAAIETKLDRLAGWLGLPGNGSGGGAAAVRAWIDGLCAELAIPSTLRELGVPDDRLDELSAMAAVDPTAETNPTPLDATAARRLYGHAFAGTGR